MKTKRFIDNLCPDNQSIFDCCKMMKMMKVNGSIEKLWTHNGFVYFKYKDCSEENPKKEL